MNAHSGTEFLIARPSPHPVKEVIPVIEVMSEIKVMYVTKVMLEISLIVL